MKFQLAVPQLMLRYVACLARLGALKYAQAQTEERLHLPHAAMKLTLRGFKNVVTVAAGNGRARSGK